MNKILLALVALTLASPTLAQGAPVGPSEKAARLVELSGIEKTLNMVFADLAPMASGQGVTGLLAHPATRDYLSDLIARLPGRRQRLEQLLSEELVAEFRKGYPEIKMELARLYQARFSEAELDDLLRFFSSGTGAKYLAAQTEIQAEMRGIGQSVGARAGEAAVPRALDRAAAEAGED